MIAQIVDHAFVKDRIDYLAMLQAVAAADAPLPAEVVAALAAEGVSIEEFRAALTALLDEGKKDLEKPRRQNESRQAFISSKRTLSLMQSALETYYEVRNPQEILTGGQGQGLAAGDAPITDRQLSETAAGLIAGEELRLFEQFSTTDAGWSSVLYAKAYAAWNGRHPFRPHPAAPFTMSDTARVVLLGDWATGVPRARKVGDAARAILLADRGNREQHVIHLGDVYYSGWSDEYRSRFFPYWPVRSGEEDLATSWCLNGNHDMYSGGEGYFRTLLGNPLFARQQGSSFFSLGNAYWLVLGLDSAYEDEALQEPQDSWAIREMQASGRANLLLSHHQPFSAYDHPSPYLLRQLEPALGRGLVRGWFWGHEHRCSVYEPRHGVEYGRCIGHGGIPSWVDDPHFPPGVRYTFRESFESGLETWALFGFAVLDFDGPSIQVGYFDEDGQQAYREELSAR